MSETSSGAGPVGGRRPVPGPADRDTFLSQQARYRRDTWKLTSLCLLAILLMGIPLSVVVSPLIWSALLLGADLLNLIRPVPDLGHLAFATIDRVLNGRTTPSTKDVATLWTALVVPGMLVMLLAWLGVLALFLRAGTGGVLLSLGARDPRPDDLEERQLVNLVSEMAIAAGIAVPRVMLLDTPAANAAAVGATLDKSVVVVSRGVLDTLDRDETEAVIGDLVGSIGNGDLRVSMVIVSVVLTMGLVQAVLGAPLGPAGRRSFFRLLRLTFRRRTPADASEREQVRDLLEQTADAPLVEPSGKTTIVDVLRLPFVMASAAFWMNEKIFIWLIVGPLIAATWRTRRYLADATAVQLTRYPDGLARALARLDAVDEAIAGAPWSSHLFVVYRKTAPSGQTRQTTDPMDTLLSFAPPLRKRLAHLAALGATIDVPRPKYSTRSRAIVAIFAVPLFGVIFAVLFGCALAMVGITLAIDMLFLLLPVGVLHWVLRVGLPGWLTGLRG